MKVLTIAQTLATANLMYGVKQGQSARALTGALGALAIATNNSKNFDTQVTVMGLSLVVNVVRTVDMVRNKTFKQTMKVNLVNVALISTALAADHLIEKHKQAKK